MNAGEIDADEMKSGAVRAGGANAGAVYAGPVDASGTDVVGAELAAGKSAMQRGPRTENEARALLQAAAGQVPVPVWLAMRWDRSGAQGWLCLDQTGVSGDVLQWRALEPSDTHALLLADGGFRIVMRNWHRACVALSLMLEAPGRVPGFHPLLGTAGLPVAPRDATPDALLATLELGVIDDDTAACLLPADGLLLAAQDLDMALRQGERLALAAGIWLDLPADVRERLAG